MTKFIFANKEIVKISERQQFKMTEYQVGGSLPIETQLYVVRSADHQLYQALKQGEFCYVLDARQMGKSSLMVKMMSRLRQSGYCCTAIDMTRIGGKSITPEQWYKGLVVELCQGFNLYGKINLKSWWNEHRDLSLIQRFSLFIEEILLVESYTEDQNSQPSIVIFFDEIDSVLSLDFSVNDFFALIRSCYNQRSLEPKYRRLTFVLLGVATPSDLINDYQRTPFNIGKAIKLNGFNYQEAQPLLSGFKNNIHNPQRILQAILYWTSGQPFLTQKLCQLVSSFPPQTYLNKEDEWIEQLIRTRVINNWQTQDEPEHLKTIRDRLLSNEDRTNSILTLYKQILKQELVTLTNRIEQQELLLSGLIINENGKLKVRNLIYREVFDLHWVETQLSQLRPYSESLRAWEKSNCNDQSRLLRGQALEDAQAWSQDKSLSIIDYRFLASSEILAKKGIELAYAAERAMEAESRLLEKQKTARLQHYLLIVLSLAFSTVLGFGMFAYGQYRQANLNEIKALLGYSQTLFASNKRFSALKMSIEIKQKWQQLNYQDPDIDKKVEDFLRQAVLGVDEYNHLSGHKSPVYSVDISPSGQKIATASLDGKVKLWQFDGTLLDTFRVHQSALWDVAFSPDGQTIATASRDKTVKLSNETGMILKTLKGHQDEVLGVAFSPDGQIIVTASRDKTVKLWKPDGKVIGTLKGHRKAVWKAIFSPDGKTIATASEDKTIKIWQLNNKGRFQLERTLKGHTDEIRNISFSADGKIIASASNDWTTKLWQSDSGKLLHTLEGHSAPVLGLTFSADGHILATGSWDNTIKIWNLEGKLMKTMNFEKNRIWDLAFSSDGKTIVSASEQKNVKLAMLDNPLFKVFRSHSEPVIDVAYSPDGKTIASASDDHNVKIWRKDGSVLTNFKSKQDSVLGVDWSPDGANLVSGHWNGGINLLKFNDVDPPRIELQKKIKGHKVGTWRVVYSPDGENIVSVSEDFTAKIWDSQGNLITDLVSHTDVIRNIAFSPDSQIIATASHDKTVKLWNIRGKLLATLNESNDGAGSVAFSPNGMMAIGDHNGEIKLWQLERKLDRITFNFIKTLKGHLGEVRQIAFSPDGQLIASASADNTIKLWQSNGELLKTMHGHQEAVWSVAFSPDGKEIASGSEDTTVIVWNIKQMLERDLLAAGCSHIKDYLRTNAEISQSDRKICNDLNQ